MTAPLAWHADIIRGRTFIRIVVGDQDALLGPNRKYHELLDSLKIEHEYIVVSGIGHREDLLYEWLGPAAVAFYANAFRDRNGGETPLAIGSAAESTMK